MPKTPEAIKSCLELVEKLHQLRVQQAYLGNQIKILTQKHTLYILDLKRLEAKKILEVDQGKQSNGQPLVKDVEVKRAMVEDLMAQDKTAITLLHKIRLREKDIQRKARRWDVINADVNALESKEKLLILQAT